jgi:hypothetical protein
VLRRPDWTPVRTTNRTTLTGRVHPLARRSTSLVVSVIVARRLAACLAGRPRFGDHSAATATRTGEPWGFKSVGRLAHKPAGTPSLCVLRQTIHIDGM